MRCPGRTHEPPEAANEPLEAASGPQEAAGGPLEAAGGPLEAAKSPVGQLASAGVLEAGRDAVHGEQQQPFQPFPLLVPRPGAGLGIGPVCGI